MQHNVCLWLVLEFLLIIVLIHLQSILTMFFVADLLLSRLLWFFCHYHWIYDLQLNGVAICGKFGKVPSISPSEVHQEDNMEKIAVAPSEVEWGEVMEVVHVVLDRLLVLVLWLIVVLVMVWMVVGCFVTVEFFFVIFVFSQSVGTVVF